MSLRDRIDEALKTHRWGGDSERDSHAVHRYYHACAICQGDTGAIADAVLAALRDGTSPLTPTHMAEIEHRSTVLAAIIREIDAHRCVQADRIRELEEHLAAARAERDRLAEQRKAALALVHEAYTDLGAHLQEGGTVSPDSETTVNALDLIRALDADPCRDELDGTHGQVIALDLVEARVHRLFADLDADDALSRLTVAELTTRVMTEIRGGGHG